MTDRAITACSLSELAEVVQLVNFAYRGQEGQAGWCSEIGLVDGLRITCETLRDEFVSTPDLQILLLRETGELLACVRLEASRGQRAEPACLISMLAVRPTVQDRGLGRVMLDHAEAQGRSRGAKVARMTVVSIRTSLIAWYERRGYGRTGETEPFPYDRQAPFGRPLRSDLEFIVLEKPLAPI